MWDRKTMFPLYYLPEGSQHKMKYSALQWFMGHARSKPHTDKRALLLLHNSHQPPQLTLSLRYKLCCLSSLTRPQTIVFISVLFTNTCFQMSHIINEWDCLVYSRYVLCFSVSMHFLTWNSITMGRPKLSNLGTNSKIRKTADRIILLLMYLIIWFYFRLIKHTFH